MKILIGVVSLLLVCIVANSTMAADKVVVVPLGSGKVPAGALPLAWGFIDSDTPKIESGYNVVSVTSPASGVYDVEMSVSWEGWPAVMATSYNTDHLKKEIITWGAFAEPVKNKIRFNISDAETMAPGPSDFSFVLYGTEKK